MDRRSPTRACLVATALALVALPAGCDDEKPKSTTPSDADAGAVDPRKPVLDSKLGAAVAAAASASAAPAASAPGVVGPPESGVFAKGVADTLHAKSAPAKVELLSEGGEPRIRLVRAIDGEQKVAVSVSVRLGPQSAMPTIDFGLAIKPEKAKADAKGEGKNAKGEGEPAAPAADAEGLRVVAKVASAGLGASQPGAVPKELGEAIAKLKGSQIRYTLGPTGAASDYAYELPKGAPPELEASLRALADAVSAMTPALPDKAVGAGAYWMVTDRTTSFGIDVVRYRVFRVEKLAGEDVSLTLEARQYAADERRVELAGAPPGLNPAIELFQSQGKGALSFGAKTIVPPEAHVNQRVQAVLRTSQGRMPMQVDMTAEIEPPPKP